MSAFEQRIDLPPNRAYQYLLVAAVPYETMGFKIPAKEINSAEGKFFAYWDRDLKLYVIQIMFKAEQTV